MFGRRLLEAKKRIAKQYTADDLPWFLGFSGGKDSTALLQALYEVLREFDTAEKPVSVVYCDTGVEIPPVAEYVRSSLEQIRRKAEGDGIPLDVRVVTPRLADTYFVKVIGRGYVPPSNKFRWCTDRLRVGPVRREMQRQQAAQSRMLLGTRWSESNERARTLQRLRTTSDFHFTQSGNATTEVFAPIATFTSKQVWEYLHARSDYGLFDVDRLTRLYTAAGGAGCSGGCAACEECTGGRFGCWVCTVVRRDKAVANMVSSGFHHLAPLLEFRDWLSVIRDEPTRRHPFRRNGQPGLGPFTLETRMEILERLLLLQASSPWPLLSAIEVSAIRREWDSDSLRGGYTLQSTPVA